MKCLRVFALAAAWISGVAVALHAEPVSAAPSAAPRNGAVCASLRIDGSVPADQRAVEKAIGEMLGCKDTTREPVLSFWTDTASPSQLARLAVVTDCLPQDIDRPRDLVEGLRCHPDLVLLDRAKLDAELDADARFDAAAKTTLREAFERTRAKVEAWTKQASELAATNPAARAVLFDAPRRAVTEWNAAYASNKEAVDAAFSFASKPGDGARGCSTAMRQHLSSYLAKRGVKTAAASTTAMSESIGFPIAEALAQCEQLDGEPLAAQAIGGSLAKSSRWYRGPRVAAYWAGVDAIESSDAAQRIFGASFGVFRKFPRVNVAAVPRPAQERDQVVVAVKAAKNGALVSFEGAASPVLFSSAHANGMAAGRRVVYLHDGTRAFPTAVFADKDKKSAIAVMGATLSGVAAPIPSPPVEKKIRRTARR
ncbi:MAG: hypothetical protein JST00_07210 [Deltaproteobacteria bacterium]|nr:hypothetical protein [Deltaproteobacteria bacterium]